MAAAPRPTPPPEPVRTKNLADQLQRRFPTIKVDYMKERRLKVTTNPDEARDVALFARDELGYDHVSCVSGTDWMAKNEIEIIYFVESLSKPDQQGIVLAISERPRRDNPVVNSLIDVWSGVEYHERETYEMLGVNFMGHPNLKNLLLPEDWNDLPPLRKDFVSPGR